MRHQRQLQTLAPFNRNFSNVGSVVKHPAECLLMTIDFRVPEMTSLGNRHVMIKSLNFLVRLLLVAFLSSTAIADTLDEIRQRGTLLWGGDASGGGPYIYEGPDGKLTGFEYE